MKATQAAAGATFVDHEEAETIKEMEVTAGAGAPRD